MSHTDNGYKGTNCYQKIPQANVVQDMNTILHTCTILLLIYVCNLCVFMVCGFSFGKYVFMFLHLQCFMWIDLWPTLICIPVLCVLSESCGSLINHLSTVLLLTVVPRAPYQMDRDTTPAPLLRAQSLTPVTQGTWGLQVVLEEHVSQITSGWGIIQRVNVCTLVLVHDLVIELIVILYTFIRIVIWNLYPCMLSLQCYLL